MGSYRLTNQEPAMDVESSAAHTTTSTVLIKNGAAERARLSFELNGYFYLSFSFGRMSNIE